MKVFILTPEKTIYEGEAISLYAPGVDGSFQLLDHHASMIALLKEGKLLLDQSPSLIFCIKNGILEVKNGKVKILINS